MTSVSEFSHHLESRVKILHTHFLGHIRYICLIIFPTMLISKKITFGVFANRGTASSIGVVASGLSWVYRADNVIAGIENPISISGEVTFTDESSQVFGDYLWRLGLFGSQFEDGSGERFNYVSQVLDDTEGSYDLISQKLTFTNGAAMFDVAAIGCTEFVYGCMEFTKSLNASTDFQFSILPSGDVLTLCKESPCLASECQSCIVFESFGGGLPFTMYISFILFRFKSCRERSAKREREREIHVLVPAKV